MIRKLCRYTNARMVVQKQSGYARAIWKWAYLHEVFTLDDFRQESLEPLGTKAKFWFKHGDVKGGVKVSQ
jgi:hypothetical protein